MTLGSESLELKVVSDDRRDFSGDLVTFLRLRSNVGNDPEGILFLELFIDPEGDEPLLTDLRRGKQFAWITRVEAVVILRAVELERCDITEISSADEVDSQGIKLVAPCVARVDAEECLVGASADEVAIDSTLEVVEGEAHLARLLHLELSRERRLRLRSEGGEREPKG